MGIEKWEYNREQKKAYQTFTKDALIDIVIRKNEQVAELQTKLLNLHNVSKLAKLMQFVQQQENIPSEFNDIVNDNFWDLI